MNVETALLMSNLLILAAFGGLLAAHIWFVKANHKKDREFLKAFMSRDLPEFDHSEKLEDKSFDDAFAKPPEFIPAEAASDELFNKMIKEETGII